MKEKFNNSGRQTLDINQENGNVTTNVIIKSQKRQKDSFCAVSEKYRNILSCQVQKENVEVKKMVFDEALKQVKGATKTHYLSDLRDAVVNRLISNLRFCRDCFELSLNPFAVAQNVAIAGKKQMDKVLSLGIASVYNSEEMKALNDELFSERELSEARFSSLTSSASEEQLNEASRLIDAVKRVLVELSNSGSQDEKAA